VNAFVGNAFFQQTKEIFERRVEFYAVCLDRFLEFHRGSFDKVSGSDLKAFGDYLEDRRNGEWEYFLFKYEKSVPAVY